MTTCSNGFGESEQAGVDFSQATPETDLDAYDELEAPDEILEVLDEIIVGM